MNSERNKPIHTITILSLKLSFWKLLQLPEDCTITISNGIAPALVFIAAKLTAKVLSKDINRIIALDLATENDYARPPLEIRKRGLKNTIMDCMWNIANVPDRPFVFFGRESHIWSEITLFGINLLAPESSHIIFTESGDRERKQLCSLRSKGWIEATAKVLIERYIIAQPQFSEYIEVVSQVEDAWISFDIAHEWRGAVNEYPKGNEEDEKTYIGRVGNIILGRVSDNAERIKAIEVSGWNISANANHHEGAHGRLSDEQLTFVREIINIVKVGNPDLIIKHEPGHLDIEDLKRVIERLNN